LSPADTWFLGRSASLIPLFSVVRQKQKRPPGDYPAGGLSKRNGFELASDGASEKAQKEEAKGELRHGMLVDHEAAIAMRRHCKRKYKPECMQGAIRL